ncbi:hypothetical protein AVEN_251741-1 [Araneus ventricosus]|uniref:Uncharacterized protein n=1 Tax=Araneus ventricosus TaxID=182803 RepID=A0A4Y2T6C9_ARAVE|nr:hypothetical protein AVEN_251741-1 [Araneus ventricosus]
MHISCRSALMFSFSFERTFEWSTRTKSSAKTWMRTSAGQCCESMSLATRFHRSYSQLKKLMKSRKKFKINRIRIEANDVLAKSIFCRSRTGRMVGPLHEPCGQPLPCSLVILPCGV